MSYLGFSGFFEGFGFGFTVACCSCESLDTGELNVMSCRFTDQGGFLHEEAVERFVVFL